MGRNVVQLLSANTKTKRYNDSADTPHLNKICVMTKYESTQVSISHLNWIKQILFSILILDFNTYLCHTNNSFW